MVADILRKRQAMKRELLKQTNLVPTRIAILGGSTTTEVKSMLELFLLAQGIEPTFYESGYNRYSEDVEFENPDLWNFKPNIVFIHTTWHNISEFPELLEAEAEVEQPRPPRNGPVRVIVGKDSHGARRAHYPEQL